MHDELSRLAIKVRALRSTMDSALKSETPQITKWQGFANFFRRYNPLAEAYIKLTGESDVVIYKIDSIPRPGSITWPNEKGHFETVYTDVQILDGLLSSRLTSPALVVGFNELLDPEITLASKRHFESGDFRNAVLDGIVCLMDELRSRTGIDKDGDDLINQAFSPSRPKLIFSDIDTESGMNDQRGFMDIFKGLYRGVRNPKAHSLSHDLNQEKAGQYLVFLSLLMRRLKECRVPD